MNNKTWMNWIRPAVLAAFAVLPGMACSYSMSVGAIPAGGGVVAVGVNTQAGCPWQVTRNVGWMSNYSTWSGRGPGTAYFYAQPNNARSARAVTLRVIAGSSSTCTDFIAGRSSVCGATYIGA